MVVLNPVKKRSFGNDSWGWAPSVANLLLPKITELQATGGFNLSCSLLRDQEGLSASTEQVTLDAVLCEMESFQVQGTTTYSMPDLRISFDPQGDDESDGRLAWETLEDGAEGVLWRRQGKRATTDLAIGDRVDLVPASLGIKIPGKSSNEAAGIYVFTQTASIVSAPKFQKKIVAGS